jgi:hypothetical protein
MVENISNQKEAAMLKLIKKTTRRLCPPYIIGLIVLSLCGCSGGGSGGSSSTASPTISAQNSVDLGAAVVSGTSAQLLTIKNTGSATLAIGQLSLAGGASSPFKIDSDTDTCSNAKIAPSSACTSSIQLTPTGQQVYTDTLTIPSNDPVNKTLTVGLTGTGMALDLKTSQVIRDFCTSTPKQLELLVSVADSTGQPATLTSSPVFTVFENGVQISNPAVTQVVTRSPLSVTLVMDYSGSLSAAEQQWMQDNTKGFIDLLLKTLQTTDEVSIMKFATDAHSTSFYQLTYSEQVLNLKAAIDAAYPYDTSSSAIWDSTYAAVDTTAAQTNNQRIVILLSDGEDYSKTHSLTDLISHAIAQKIPVFTVTVLHTNHSYPALMQQLALQTGGQTFSASVSAASSDVTALQGVYNNISQILTSQYTIVYNTASTGGVAVTLDVKLNDNGNLGEFSGQVTGCP